MYRKLIANNLMTRSYATLNWVCPLYHSYNDITLLLITSNVHDYETNHLLINKLVKRLTSDSLLFTYHTCINVSVNTIIAWYINIIINTKIYNNHLLLPLGHISNRISVPARSRDEELPPESSPSAPPPSSSPLLTPMMRRE